MKSKITAICFLLLLFGLTIFSIFKPPTIFSEKENRYLEQKPVFSFSSLLDGSYSADYETYLSDQFPGRDQWIRIKSMNEQLLQKKDMNGVYLGKDQYLIEQPDRTVFESSQSQKNIDCLSDFVQRQTSHLGQSHVQVMVVPSASQILTEKLPLFASPYEEERFLSSVRSSVGDDHFIDVTPTLSSHQQEYIYYRTDHHWTTLGAFYAYQQWANSIGISPYAQNDFTIKTVSDSFYGTIQAKVNLPVSPDSMNVFLPNFPITYTVTYNESEPAKDSLYEWDALKIRDKYRFYLNGNQPITHIQTSSDSRRNLLVIKDSFANSFIPFAANHFDQTVVVDLRYFNGDGQALIDNYHITDILVLYQASFLAKESSVIQLNRWQ